MTDKFILVVGRRKESIARVRLYEGRGEVTVNGKKINEYFFGTVAEKFFSKPFETAQVVGKYYATITVVGGGTASQLGAVVHGLSRALAKADKKYKTLVKKQGLLTRDARVKERRKYGHAQKARAMKQSPKR